MYSTNCLYENVGGGRFELNPVVLPLPESVRLGGGAWGDYGASSTDLMAVCAAHSTFAYTRQFCVRAHVRTCTGKVCALACARTSIVRL